MVMHTTNKRQHDRNTFILLAVGALAVAVLVALAVIRGAPAPAASQHVVHDAKVLLTGIACGSHLAVEPSYITAKPGSSVRIVNDSPWPHHLHLSKKNASPAADSKDVLASSPLAPGAEWIVEVPNKPGDYFIVSDNAWYHLAGLRGEIQVR